MGYYMDGNATGLDDLQRRLQSTDLIPSQEPLLVGLEANLDMLKQHAITSVADLRSALKSKASLEMIAETTGIAPGYLGLLRRAVEGFFPKPRRLGEIDWLDQGVVAALSKIGVKNTRHLFERVESDLPALAKAAGVLPEDIAGFNEIAGLCRVQWLSPSYARVLVAAGFPDVTTIAKAKPDTLYQAMIEANQGAKFYKGKVGLRDVKRLVVAAGYVA